MAASVSEMLFPVSLEQERTLAEGKEVKKKQVALMEKLRTKQGTQHKSWTDSLMKSIRTSVVDRKVQSDSSERDQVQSCLYTLQRAMKVISQQSLVERLEVVARHQGLSLTTSGSEEPCVTLQADMFHIDIALNKGGGVKEVKIAHQGDATVCNELTNILSRGDFPEFTSHLEGLQSIYQITGEKKLKPKVFLALQSLEKDLTDLAQFQNSINGVANYIHKSPLGILLPRTAGKPMKLIYFVSPYDLLDKKTQTTHPMTVEAITEHNVGRSVTVCLEPGASNKLQTMPLMSVAKSLPSFIGLSHANSANLPACFMLVLPQPVPVALSLLHKIDTVTKLDTAKDMGTQPLLSLILDSNSGGKMKKEQQLYVSLPDQHQCYFINGVSGGVLEEPGVMVSRIPFTHPTHVGLILSYLRQQLLFNSVLASCIRPAAQKDVSSCLVFEMTVISLTQMTVVFEHPAHDTIVTVDLDLSDITSLKCRLLCNSGDLSLCTDEYASRVLQRSLSLPILLRCLVRKGRTQLEKLLAEAQALAEEQARRAREAALWIAAQLRQQQARLPPSMPSKGRPPPPQPPPLQLTPTHPPTPSPIHSNPPSVGDLPSLVGGVDLLGSSPPAYPGLMGPDTQDKQNNPLLVNLLDNERGGPTIGSSHPSNGSVVNESPMLSRLLDDNISVATNISPISVPNTLHQIQPKTKGTRGRKRRGQADLVTGRSPKHRLVDSDSLERFGSIDFESSSSPFDSSFAGMGNFHHQMGLTPPSRPSSHGHMSSVIDLTEDNMPESSLKKLVNFSNFLPPQEMRAGNSTPESELHALLNEQDLDSSPSGLKPNQMTGSKNENASTSLEGFLMGSGGVGKASLPDPGAVPAKMLAHSSSLSSTSPLSFLGHGQATRQNPQECNHERFSQQAGGRTHFTPNHRLSRQPVCRGGSLNRFPPDYTTPISASPKMVSSGSMTEAIDIQCKAVPLWNKYAAAEEEDSSSSDDEEEEEDKESFHEKFDFMGQTVSSSDLIITSSSISTSSFLEGEKLTAPKVRLKLHPFRTSLCKAQSLDSGVVQSPSSTSSRCSSTHTFEFCSDEEEDEILPKHSASTDQFSVRSASPTRLQISNKGRTPEVPKAGGTLYFKPEKYRRRDKTSGNSRRKKDRSESKKEKKKKRHGLDACHPSDKHPVYRASTVEVDHNSGTKLKIRVSKEPVSALSPFKDNFHVNSHSEKNDRFSKNMNTAFSRNPMAKKPGLQKEDVNDIHFLHNDGGMHKTDGMHGDTSDKPMLKSHNGITDKSHSLDKADPKLASATIRLKPLDLNCSALSSVSLSEPGKRVPYVDDKKGRSLSLTTSTASPSSCGSPPFVNRSSSGVDPRCPFSKTSHSSWASSDFATSTSSDTLSNCLTNTLAKNNTSSSSVSNLIAHGKKTARILDLNGSRPHPSSFSYRSLGTKFAHTADNLEGPCKPPAHCEHSMSENLDLPPKYSFGKCHISSNFQNTTKPGNKEAQKDTQGSHHSFFPQKSHLSSSDGLKVFEQRIKKNMFGENQGALKDCRLNGNIPRSTNSVESSKNPYSLVTKTAVVKLDNLLGHRIEHPRFHSAYKQNYNRPTDAYLKTHEDKSSDRSSAAVNNSSRKSQKSITPNPSTSPIDKDVMSCRSSDQDQKMPISPDHSESVNSEASSPRAWEESIGTVGEGNSHEQLSPVQAEDSGSMPGGWQEGQQSFSISCDHLKLYTPFVDPDPSDSSTLSMDSLLTYPIPCSDQPGSERGSIVATQRQGLSVEGGSQHTKGSPVPSPSQQPASVPSFTAHSVTGPPTQRPASAEPSHPHSTLKPGHIEGQAGHTGVLKKQTDCAGDVKSDRVSSLEIQDVQPTYKTMPVHSGSKSMVVSHDISVSLSFRSDACPVSGHDSTIISNSALSTEMSCTDVQNSSRVGTSRSSSNNLLSESQTTVREAAMTCVSVPSPQHIDVNRTTAGRFSPHCIGADKYISHTSHNLVSRLKADLFAHKTDSPHEFRDKETDSHGLTSILGTDKKLTTSASNADTIGVGSVSKNADTESLETCAKAASSTLSKNISHCSSVNEVDGSESVQSVASQSETNTISTLSLCSSSNTSSPLLCGTTISQNISSSSNRKDCVDTVASLSRSSINTNNISQSEDGGNLVRKGDPKSDDILNDREEGKEQKRAQDRMTSGSRSSSLVRLLLADQKSELQHFESNSPAPVPYTSSSTVHSAQPVSTASQSSVNGRSSELSVSQNSKLDVNLSLSKDSLSDGDGETSSSNPEHVFPSQSESPAPQYVKRTSSENIVPDNECNLKKPVASESNVDKLTVCSSNRIFEERILHKTLSTKDVFSVSVGQKHFANRQCRSATVSPVGNASYPENEPAKNSGESHCISKPCSFAVSESISMSVASLHHTVKQARELNSKPIF